MGKFYELLNDSSLTTDGANCQFSMAAKAGIFE